MCFFSSSRVSAPPPPVPAPPQPAPTKQAESRITGAGDTARKRAAALLGGTLKTSGLGLLSAPDIQRKTLLGQ